MRKCLILGLALVAAACASEEEQLENAIREGLADRGTVEEVDLSGDGNRLTGHAVVRLADGREGRFNCSAERAADSSTNFNWTCIPAIDDAMLAQMEQTIRTDLEQRVEVVEVDLQKDGEDRMRGHAVVTDGNEQLRVPCTAERDGEASDQFRWECRPE